MWDLARLDLACWGRVLCAEGRGETPDFTLPTIGDRTPVSLSNFRGKKVLLIQFASW